MTWFGKPATTLTETENRTTSIVVELCLLQDRSMNRCVGVVPIELPAQKAHNEVLLSVDCPNIVTMAVAAV